MPPRAAKNVPHTFLNRSRNDATIPGRSAELGARCWWIGEECLAALHLAFARLPKLDDPTEAARRLFFADALIASGAAEYARQLFETKDRLKGIQVVYTPWLEDAR